MVQQRVWIPALAGSSLLLLSVAACGGNSAPSQPNTPAPPVYQVPTGLTPLLTSMYQQLPNVIASSLSQSQQNLPNNQHIASFIQAKIAMLQRPTLAVEIADGRMYAEASATSIDERRIEFAALFPEERMRVDAMQALTVLRESLPVLERFLDTPFPAPSVRVWYGFKVGNSGGNGVIENEDRASYEARQPPLPYEPALHHELAHTYIGNEILNQFLELYAYNRIRGATTDLSTWTFTRGYTGPGDGNRDVALVLDVYQMLGHDAMARAYKAAFALRPPYGQPLSPAVRQAFVDQAPEHLRAAVDDKLSRITF